MILIPTFIVSLVGVFGMLFLKVAENKRKRKDALGRFLSSFDSLVHNHLSTLGDSYDVFHQQGVSFFEEELPKQSKYFFLLINKRLREQFEILWPNIRGSKVLKEGGPVSPFLSTISKHRETIGGGRIDDHVIE
jgi:hypothetical protein